MSLAVTLLGTGSPMPSPDRAGPATLISTGAESGAESDAEHYLVDAGRGVLMRLAACGLGAPNLGAVFITHLHSDHMGWLSVDGNVTFANATVHIGAADWQYYVEDGNAGRRNTATLRAVEDRVELVHDDGVTLLPGMTTRLTPGHTPGHMSTVISSGNERLIVLGDALHCPAQLTELEWEFFYDVDAALARKTRAALVEEAAVPNTSLLPCHFPEMQASRLLPVGDAAPQWMLS